MARSDAVELWSVSHCTAHVPGVTLCLAGLSCGRAGDTHMCACACGAVWPRARGTDRRHRGPWAPAHSVCRAQGARQSLGVMRCVVWSLVCWARPVKRSGRSELARSPRAHRVLLHTHLQLTWSLNSNSPPFPLSFFLCTFSSPGRQRTSTRDLLPLLPLDTSQFSLTRTPESRLCIGNRSHREDGGSKSSWARSLDACRPHLFVVQDVDAGVD